MASWAVGGTDAIAPHWYYVPIMVAGTRFGPRGAVLTAVTAAVLAGPLTPADVSAGSAAQLSDWLARGVFFTIGGLAFAETIRHTRRSMEAEIHDLRLHTELTGAVEREEFVVDYQPVVRLADRQVIGMEALVRWEHPEHGRIMPDQFIAACEQGGQIVPLGALVLDAACRQLARWLDGPIAPADSFRVAVNVSGHQLEQDDFAAVVDRTLRRWRVPPDRLAIEVTESVLVTEDRRALRQLDRLRALGVRVAVDDFGTGYSSLAYLRQLPVDIVKIDRAFVQRLGASMHDDDRRIAAGIIDLAHDLGLHVVAEGVEREDQAEVLRSLGCEIGQGFLFSLPLPADRAGALLARGTRPARPETPVPPRVTESPSTAAILRRALRPPDTGGQHHARTSALAALFAAGAVLALTNAALMPEKTTEVVAAAALGALGIPSAALLVRVGPRLPHWTIHAMLALGTVLVSLGAYLAGDPGLTVATATLYVWVALYAAAFFEWPAAAVHFAFTAGCLTGVLTATNAEVPRGILIMLLGSAAVAAGVIGWLARQLRAVASTDLLTGLPNRQAFEGLLPREIAQAERRGRPLCLAVVDVDDFKEINDTHGHQAGDGILSDLPGHWQRALRRGDVLARIGGDEFVALLPDCDLENATAVLERMAGAGRPTCSVGVAQLDEGETPDRLLARADRALYRAKAAGAGLVVADGAEVAVP